MGRAQKGRQTLPELDLAFGEVFMDEWAFVGGEGYKMGFGETHTTSSISSLPGTSGDLIGIWLAHYFSVCLAV